MGVDVIAVRAAASAAPFVVAAFLPATSLAISVVHALGRGSAREAPAAHLVAAVCCPACLPLALLSRDACRGACALIWKAPAVQLLAPASPGIVLPGTAGYGGTRRRGGIAIALRGDHEGGERDE